MNRKSCTKGKSAEVFIDCIANSLPVDTWFCKSDFSRLTGILSGSSYERIKTLIDGGYLESKGRSGQVMQYRMTFEMQLMMIERGKINKSNRGRTVKKKPIRTSKEEILKSEAEAYKINSEMLLRSIKFI